MPYELMKANPRRFVWCITLVVIGQFALSNVGYV